MDFTEKHLKVEGGKQLSTCSTAPSTHLFWGILTCRYKVVAAKRCDVYLTGENLPAQAVEQEINEVRRLAERRRKKGPFWYSISCHCSRNRGRGLE